MTFFRTFAAPEGIRISAAPGCDNHGDAATNKVGRQRRQAVELIVRPAVFNGDVPALDEAGRTEPLTEALDIRRNTVSRGRAKKPDRRRRRLLRAR